MDELIRAERLAARQFNDAPRELKATIALAMNALKDDHMGEALSELNRAHKLVKDHRLDEWRAEVAACWAVFYYRQNEPGRMNEAIAYARKLEPDNKRLGALLRVLNGEA